MDKTLVYKYPGKYAREQDELELYRASCKANIACKEAIETAVNSHYNKNCLDTKAAVREVVKQFGYERMLYILAVTAGKMEWDGMGAFPRQIKIGREPFPSLRTRMGLILTATPPLS